MFKRLIIVMLSMVILVETISASFASDNLKSPETTTATTEESLYILADKLTDLLISTRNVIALNQDLINTCPNPGHYSFKGLTPAVVGTQIGNDFYLRTGIKMKQTSLKVRNPRNAPDEWERRAMEMFETPDYPEGTAIAGVAPVNGEEAYRFIKPIYITKACLRCHADKKDIPVDIIQYLELNYPNDEATGYREGDLRGGISITIPVTERVLGK